MHSFYRLSNIMNKLKTILITGATSGIGCRIAENLNGKYQLFLSGRNETKLSEINKKLSHVLPYVTCDVTFETDIEKLASEAPQIDGLVYCGGIAPTVPVKYIRENDILKTFAVNFNGAVLVVAALLKQKKINPGSSLIFISSEAVRHPFFGSTVYSASKAALESFALTLSNELQSKKIRANCISPTYVESPMLDQARNTMSEEFIAGMKKMHPEAFSTADRIASVAAFLLSDESSAINGQIIKAGRFNINIPGL